MKTTKRKVWSVLGALLISMCLLAGIMPMTAFAADPISLPVRTIEAETGGDYVSRPEIDATFTPDTEVSVGEFSTEYQGLAIDYYNPMSESAGLDPVSEGYDIQVEYTVSVPLLNYDGETLSGTLTVPLPEGYDGATARIKGGETAIGHTADTVSFPVTLEVSGGTAEQFGILIEYKEAQPDENPTGENQTGGNQTGGNQTGGNQTGNGAAQTPAENEGVVSIPNTDTESSLMLWSALLILSGGAIGVMTRRKKKQLN